MADAAQKIGDLVSLITNIAGQTNLLALNATTEIARSIQQAAAGAQEVSDAVMKLTQTAGETGAAAGQVQGAAGGLSKQAETLRGDVDRFLAAIKAA